MTEEEIIQILEDYDEQSEIFLRYSKKGYYGVEEPVVLCQHIVVQKPHGTILFNIKIFKTTNHSKEDLEMFIEESIADFVL